MASGRLRGQVQAAIDGPLTDVIALRKYDHSPDRIYSARDPCLMYVGSGGRHGAMPDMVLSMDGWDDELKNEFRCKAIRGSGYELVELKRYDEAVVAYKACMKVIPGEPKSKPDWGISRR